MWQVTFFFTNIIFTNTVISSVGFGDEEMQYGGCLTPMLKITLLFAVKMMEMLVIKIMVMVIILSKVNGIANVNKMLLFLLLLTSTFSFPNNHL